MARRDNDGSIHLYVFHALSHKDRLLTNSIEAARCCRVTTRPLLWAVESDMRHRVKAGGEAYALGSCFQAVAHQNLHTCTHLVGCAGAPLQNGDGMVGVLQRGGEVPVMMVSSSRGLATMGVNEWAGVYGVVGGSGCWWHFSGCSRQRDIANISASGLC